MTLTTGIRLGPYEIQSPFGAGAMGEVCRARDPKVNRDVAIKAVSGPGIAGSRVRPDSSMKRHTTGKPKKQSADSVLSGLTESEQDLLSHLQNGYQLETESLGGDLLLRRLKNSEVIRPLSATRNTVKALQERGLIAPAEGDDPLRVVWHLQKTKAAKKSRR